MFLHVHDREVVTYEGECPVCAPVLAENPQAVIIDAAPGVAIDG